MEIPVLALQKYLSWVFTPLMDPHITPCHDTPPKTNTPSLPKVIEKAVENKEVNKS